MNYGCQSMVKEVKDILIKRPKEAWKNQDFIKDQYEYNLYYGEPDFDLAQKEYEIFENILKDHVDRVYYLPEDDITSLDSIYAHDSLKITKKGAIYFNMTKESRKNESKASSAFLKDLGIPTLGWIQGPGRMEGGDVLWLDEKTVAIGQGYRTNSQGIRQFRDLTKDFIDEVIEVPLPHGVGKGEVLHLMSLISPLDEDLALVYSRYMPVFFRQILIDRGIKLIEVDDEEYERLGCNVLTLAPKLCVMMEGLDRTQAKIEEAGCKVYTYPGKEISLKGTGGATCFTSPLYRN